MYLWRILSLRIFLSPYFSSEGRHVVLVYYLIVSTIALIFFLFLAWLRKFFQGLSLRLIIMMVFWVYAVSFFLPGLISIIPPLIVFLGVFFLVLLGGYFILEKVSVTTIVEEKAVPGEEKTEEGPEAVKPVEPEETPETGEVSLPEMTATLTAKALQVKKVLPVAGKLPTELLALPKELFMLSPAWQEPLFLLLDGSKVQRKEVISLSNHRADFQGLIDSAFQAKEEKNYPLAVEKFKEALPLAEDVSVKGMIYTEFVFLYKEMGKYLEAAGLIEGFLLENGSSLSASLRHHFKKVVEYLLTIEELLKKAEHPDLPFSQIPHLIKIRAEKVFQE